jgi:intracellular proteinase inhibitor BsuPI
MLRIAVLTLVAGLAALPDRPPPAFAETPILVLMLATDAPEYTVGALVTFTVALDNRGEVPVTLTFPSAQLFDIAVLNEQREIWRWSAERDFAQAETERAFPSGVTLIGRATWDLRDSSGTTLLPGRYEIQGSLATIPRQPGNVLQVRLLGV